MSNIDLGVGFNEEFGVDYETLIKETHPELTEHIYKTDNTLSHWIEILLTVSILTTYNHLADFLELRTMLEYDSAYKSDTKLPIVLQLYFLHVSKQLGAVTCPKCGGLIIRQAWFEGDEEYGIECAEHLSYSCCNCDFICTTLKEYEDELLKINDDEREYIQCSNCRSKIHGKNWLDIKESQDNREAKAKCPVCGQINNNYKFKTQIDSENNIELEIARLEMVLEVLGYNLNNPDIDVFNNIRRKYKAEDNPAIAKEPRFKNEVTSYEDKLNYLKDEISMVDNIFNKNYLNNIYIIEAELNGVKLGYEADELDGIFSNIGSIDFDLHSIRHCKFKILSSHSDVQATKNKTINSTKQITKLLQVWQDKNILGYIIVEQDITKSNKVIISQVNKHSDKKLQDLCTFYTKLYSK